MSPVDLAAELARRCAGNQARRQPPTAAAGPEIPPACITCGQPARPSHYRFTSVTSYRGPECWECHTRKTEG